MNEEQKIQILTQIAKSATIQQLNLGDGYQQININPQPPTPPSADSFCSYIVPNPPKSRAEIEEELVRTSSQAASVFASCLMRLEKQGCLDFGKDSVSTIFDYLKKRYKLSYNYPNFSAVFRANRK